MITNRRLRNASENVDWGNDNKEKSGRSRESVIGNGEGKARSERSQISKITMPMARRKQRRKDAKLDVGYPIRRRQQMQHMGYDPEGNQFRSGPRERQKRRRLRE